MLEVQIRPAHLSMSGSLKPGGHYEKVADRQSFASVDGHLITSQNPASSKAAAQALVKMLLAKKTG